MRPGAVRGAIVTASRRSSCGVKASSANRSTTSRYLPGRARSETLANGHREQGEDMKRLALVAVLAAFLATGVTAAQAAPTALPAPVYAPYFETWTTDSLTTTAPQSGARYFTLAFLETLSKTSCTLAWDGDSARPISAGGYASDIASLRALGGDVIPSFGGWSADQGGTEIGDSCKDVSSIAAAYETLITKYNVSRLDMDIEGRSLTKADGIDRRNKAIKLVQDWAAANGRPLQISYTLPTSASGLESSGVAVLQNAIANNTRVDVVNIMTFDYYDRVTKDMGAAAINAANGLVSQLAILYPGKTLPQRQAMVGITLMPGLDDYPRRTESTSVVDAQRVYNYAASNGFNTLSIWAVQRDNGGCPGNTGSNSCSGIVQNTWDFSHVLNPF